MRWLFLLALLPNLFLAQINHSEAADQLSYRRQQNPVGLCSQNQSR